MRSEWNYPGDENKKNAIILSPMSNEQSFQQISNSIYRLNIPWKISRLMAPIPVGVYLIQEHDGFKLIDTALPNMQDIIIQALGTFFDKEITDNNNSKQSIIQQINSIYITHFHHDHCGSLQALWELSDKSIPVYAHEAEIPFIQDGKKLKDQKSHNWLYSVGRMIIGSPDIKVSCQSIDKVLNVCGSETAKSSETISNISDNLLSYYHCPGHTPGHCCYYHAQDGILLCGDACQNYTGKLSDSFVMATPNPRLAKDSLKQMVRDVDFTKLVPSHDLSENGVEREDVIKFLKL
jgi:glyoxylase-like metal-dependent hydrolase (beta-lactamase superfamily II)